MGKPPSRIRRITDASPKSLLADRFSGGVFGGMSQLESVAKRRPGLGRIGGQGRAPEGLGEIVTFPGHFGSGLLLGTAAISPSVALPRPGLWSVTLQAQVYMDDSGWNPATDSSFHRLCQVALVVDRGPDYPGPYRGSQTGALVGRSEDQSGGSAGEVPLTGVFRVGRDASFAALVYVVSGPWPWEYNVTGYAEYLAP